MNLAETHALLTLAATLDNRRFDDAAVVAWQEILADQPFDDCRTAVINHFRDSTEYLMPVHVVRGAEQIDQDRLRAARRAERLQAMAELEAARPVQELRDRSAEIAELLRRLRDSLPPVDPVKFRRAEVLAWERQQRTAANAEPNPHYDPTVWAETILAEHETATALTTHHEDPE